MTTPLETTETGTAEGTTLGVDVGGTFTDLALWNGREITVGKVSSTTSDQSEGVVAGAAEIVPEEVVAQLLHGTTVATNALLERRGATTLLITNRGFESIVEIARQDRPSLYDVFADRPTPLVETHLRMGVDVSAATPDEEVGEMVDRIIAVAKDSDVEAVAICLLYSYDDPTQERRLRDLLIDRVDIPVSISSEVVAEFREYERLSTTVLNAFLSPEVARYMGNLQDRADSSGLVSEIAVMRSSGGLISVRHASKFPASILLSGPAGGVVATAALGELLGHDTLISFDMGGTSSDVCRVERGRPEVTYHRQVDGFDCLMPSVAVHTVGAGGGSIAWVDDGGALRVGPRSAGAVPGPACYDRGGTEPTVTDANLVLGRLDPTAQLAGTVSLRRDLAFIAFDQLATKTGLDPIEVAKGTLAVVESHMTHAIRAVSVEQGTDPREAVLVAFGGAGGLHASAVARSLDMKGVVIPPYAGVFSAFGLLLSPPRADLARTINLTEDDRHTLRERGAELLEAARRQVLADSGQAAIAEGLVVDMRYVGQAHETSVPYSLTDSWETLCGHYHGLHEQHNGFSRPEDKVEAVTMRAEAVGTAALGWDELPPFTATSPFERPARNVITADGQVMAQVWWRLSLEPGSVVTGPAIIEEGESTIFLDVGDTATVHPTGALEITW